MPVKKHPIPESKCPRTDKDVVQLSASRQPLLEREYFSRRLPGEVLVPGRCYEDDNAKKIKSLLDRDRNIEFTGSTSRHHLNMLAVCWSYTWTCGPYCKHGCQPQKSWFLKSNACSRVSSVAEVRSHQVRCQMVFTPCNRFLPSTHT